MKSNFKDMKHEGFIAGMAYFITKIVGAGAKMPL